MKLRKLALAGIAATALLSVTACGKTAEKKDTYTLNNYTTTFPSTWNPHTYQTATDSTILDYCSAGFYTFDYNSTKDGYQIVADMATGDPVDVTSKYVGEEWGIKEGDTAKAWSIPLRDDLKWNDGTAITAQDFVTSAKLLLDPVAQNYRADSLYAGTMAIHNAKEYLYQGKHAYSTPMVSANYGDDEYVDPNNFTKNDAGNYIYTDAEGVVKDMCIFLNNGGNWGSNGLADYYKAKYLTTVEEQYKVLEEAADDENKVLMNETTLPALQDCIAALHNYANAAAYAEAAGDYAYQEWEEMAFYGTDYAAMDFDAVGVKADGNNLEIVINNPLSGFYLLYNLTSTWLVKEDLYNSNASTKDGVYTNTYGSSVETTASYGPYMLTEFQLDKTFKLEKNPYYFGYNDEANKDLYQTTAIVYTKVADSTVALQMFEKGQVDSYGLTADDMATYSESPYLYYTEGASTFFVALNPDLNGLTETQATATASKAKEINKTILTVDAFRKGLSLAINRKDFCLACDPTGIAATAVFNKLIIADPENGTAYRTYEESKDVVLEFWGLTDSVGEGKRYATKDEAIDAITGVDLTQAKAQFDAAYDEAIEKGLMTENATIELCIGVPSTANFYVKGYDYLVNCWTDAVKGTKLEGKLTFTKDDTIGNGFADALRGNKVDVLFGVGWTGAALDPYSLVSAYTEPQYQYDPAIDYSAETLEITFDEITATDGTVYNDITLSTDVYTWSYPILNGNAVDVAVVGDDNLKAINISAGTDAPIEVRLAILQATEGAILRHYTLLPLDDEASSALKGMKIKYYTEQYIYGVGRGGVKYMTYNYTDAEWKDYVASQGGTLNYK